MSILIIGGTHGGEPSGVQLVAYLQEQPIPGVATLIAHSAAVAAQKRYLQTDLNRSANTENPQSLEERLAHSLKEQISAHDLVIDFHNTTAQDTTCVITNEYPNDTIRGLARAFNIFKIVVIPSTKNLISYAKIGVGIEITRNNTKKYSTKALHKSLQRWTDQEREKEKEIKLYEFVSTVPKMPGAAPMVLQNFAPLTATAKKILGISGSGLHAIFYGEKEYPDLVCTLVRRIK